MYHDADVAGRDMVNNSRWGVAPTITFGLNSPTRVTLSYYHMQTDDLPDSGIPYAYPSTKVKRDGSYMGVSRTAPPMSTARTSTAWPATTARPRPTWARSASSTISRIA